MEVKIRLEGHTFQYQVEDILRMFYHNMRAQYVETEPPGTPGGIFVFSGFFHEGEEGFSQIRLKLGDQVIEDRRKQEKGLTEKGTIQRHLFDLMKQHSPVKTPWGILTGIRPSKIVHEMLAEGKNKEEILQTMKTSFRVSEEKSGLLYHVAKSEEEILRNSAPNSVSLYIGIPFCTSRCLYCSFTSSLISKYRHRTMDYLRALKVEMQGVQEILRNSGSFIQSIYIGGGTPTSIDHEALKRLLQMVEAQFDLSRLEEYTLEAGRPDSFDRQKLEIIKDSRVDRISINPQTMNNETLYLIGRNHTAEDIAEAFHMAKALGFDNVNMDVIAGLPGENPAMFRSTLEKIRDLGPESLTVHTMSVKRASRLHEQMDSYGLAAGEMVAQMVDMGQQYAESMGLHPYYLYRQKNILGNLENIGYCRPGLESIYNVQIMEEKQTIIALGAGGVTKVVYPEENRIERAFNVKSVEEYLQRAEEMVERKRALLL